MEIAKRAFETEEKCEELCDAMLFQVRAATEANVTAVATDMIAIYVGGLMYMVDEITRVKVDKKVMVDQIKKLLGEVDA